MTKTELIAKVRLLSRTTTSGASDAEVTLAINEAFLQFSKDVHGIESKEFLSLTASFMPRTVQAFNLVIVGSTNNDIDSDIQVGTSTEKFMSGTDLATNLQAAIRTAIGAGADLTVTWTNFYFTVDGIDSTSIAITAPDANVAYYSAISELFGGAQSGTTSITGDFPVGCTIYVDLPSNPVKVHLVKYDQKELIKSPNPEDFTDPLGTGDPLHYRIRMGKIQVSPVPSTLKKFYIEYTKELDVEGDAVGVDQTEPNDYYQTQAICYHAAAQLLEWAYEEQKAVQRYSKYKKVMNEYICWIANQNPKPNNGGSPQLNYTVVEE